MTESVFNSEAEILEATRRIDKVIAMRDEDIRTATRRGFFMGAITGSAVTFFGLTALNALSDDDEEFVFGFED